MPRKEAVYTGVLSRLRVPPELARRFEVRRQKMGLTEADAHRFLLYRALDLPPPGIEPTHRGLTQDQRAGICEGCGLEPSPTLAPCERLGRECNCCKDCRMECGEITPPF